MIEQSAGAALAGPVDFPRYVSAQLHCHSSIEGPASIGAHCYEAARAGVEVVWLTDHDTRISLCIGGPFLDAFDFESPELTTSVDRVASGGKSVQRSVGWQTGNNFATHIRSDSTDEDALITGLRSGDVYMADPILFRGRPRYGDRAGHRMGQVALSRTKHGAGHRATEMKTKVEAEMNTELEAELEAEVAAEGASAGEGSAIGRGRCIALTNPIWYVPAPTLAAVPAERRA